jgi:NADPH:quinone reductase
MTVLIAGGAGAVAHYAIQLAKLRGARSTADRAAGLDELTELLERGRLIHAVGRRLQDVAAAHELVERGEAVGNVVVEIP